MKESMVDEEHKASQESVPLGAVGADSERHKVHKAAGAFRTISEVADELHVPQHVLRFWESKFPQVRPLKRGGGRRYYRPEDVMLLRRVADMLYTQGYTIKGVQRLLRDNTESVSLPFAREGLKREEVLPASGVEAEQQDQEPTSDRTLDAEMLANAEEGGIDSGLGLETQSEAEIEAFEDDEQLTEPEVALVSEVQLVALAENEIVVPTAPVKPIVKALDEADHLRATLSKVLSALEELRLTLN